MQLLGVSMALAIVLISGCAKVQAVKGNTVAERPSPGKGTTLPGSSIRASGFLDNIGALQPAPGNPCLWQYVKQDANWKAYDKVFVEPLEVWLNPEADHSGIRPELYGEIDRRFKAIVANGFQAEGYRIADRPGPGVLVFRGALTGVTPIRQGFEPSDVLPIKAAVNAGKHALGAEPYYIVLSGEVEILDGATGERLLAAVGARRGFQTTAKGSQISWSELKDTFAWVAERWRQQLQRARG